MKRELIKSSNLKSVGYDPADKIMEVEFQNGGVYQYKPILAEAYEALKASDSPGYFLTRYVKDRGVPCTRVSACTHVLGITGDERCSRCGDELEKKGGIWVSKRKENHVQKPGGAVLAALQKVEKTWKPGLSFTHHLWCVCGRPNYKKGVETLYTQCLKAIGSASKSAEIGPEHLGAAIVLAKEQGI